MIVFYLSVHVIKRRDEVVPQIAHRRAKCHQFSNITEIALSIGSIRAFAMKLCMFVERRYRMIDGFLRKFNLKITMIDA